MQCPILVFLYKKTMNHPFNNIVDFQISVTISTRIYKADVSAKK